MKVAVTGATGFIGRHVLAALAGREGVEVVVAGRRALPTDAAPGSGSVRQVKLDIATPSPDDFALLGRPDVLVHLAWSGLPNYRSLHHFESELPLQYRFLAGLVRSGLPAMVCTGTCFEYGMQSGPLGEDLDPDPTNPYGFAKDALRRQLTFLRDESAFGMTWARLFYMYGEGQSPRSLYAQLNSAAARGDHAFKMSAGEQLRDYLPVTEVAENLVALALAAPDSGVVNVCSGQPVSVRALVEKWIRENGWKLQLEMGCYPYPDYEPMAFWGRNERLKSVLGSTP
jgi:nucleoside-diphosphate-sugar epimerase